MSDVYQSAYTGSQIDQGIRKSISRRVGSLFVSGNDTPTDIAVAQTYYPVAAASTQLSNGQFTVLNSRLTYTGAETIMAMVIATTCLSLDDQNEQVRMRIGKNGVTLPESCAQATLTGTPGSGRRESLATHTIVSLSTGDYLEVFVGNWNTAADITVRNMQFSALEL
jgi:hypothetical protein